MFIGVAQEIVDRISETNSPSDTILKINDLIHLIKNRSKELISELERAKVDFAAETRVCCNCGSSEFREQKYNEPTDRDGGRVVFITRYICKQCGNIIDY